MSQKTGPDPVEKLRTWIEGFDLVSFGGLPHNRTTLISGTPGSAKTVFAVQFLAAGVVHADEAGVFVTFEESPDDIRRNVRGFGWDVAGWEAAGKWAFVDASPEPGEPAVVSGGYDFGGLLSRLEHAVRKVNARRLAMDSLGGIFGQFLDSTVVRSELFRVVAALKRLGVTAVITAERTGDDGELSRYGVEEFVADNVVILRNSLEQEKRRRTLEILKFRGTDHQKGAIPFTISSRGIVLLPLSDIELKQKSTDLRVPSGIAELDRMCGGGFFRDSIILVSGATGAGKTLMVTEFVGRGVSAGERCLLFAFEESHDQLFRNAKGWGIDFPRMEADGLLKVVAIYPESASLEDHLLAIKSEIEAFKPHRVALDSLSALERVASLKSFREFVVGLTAFVKEKQVTGLFTATTSSLMGGTSITETHISTITDSIILLRYVEVMGEIRRGLTVLKMRGSAHDKGIREFTIDGRGMHIGKSFRHVSGILSGNATYAGSHELTQMDEMFRDDRAKTPAD